MRQGVRAEGSPRFIAIPTRPVSILRLIRGVNSMGEDGMRKLFMTTAAALIFVMPQMLGSAFAGSADGLWKTSVSEDGGYLEVTIASCASDGAKTCGTITRAYSKKGEAPDYAHLGKLIIKDMEPDGDMKFSDGTIWDPEEDKTYNSKIEVKGDIMVVDGCVLFICKGQDWTRVK